MFCHLHPRKQSRLTDTYCNLPTTDKTLEFGTDLNAFDRRPAPTSYTSLQPDCPIHERVPFVPITFHPRFKRTSVVFLPILDVISPYLFLQSSTVSRLKTNRGTLTMTFTCLVISNGCLRLHPRYVCTGLLPVYIKHPPFLNQFQQEGSSYLSFRKIDQQCR